MKTSVGITFTDILGFFKGDSPAVQCEVGDQKGCHYFYGACGIHATRVLDFDHAFRCPLQIYEHHQAIVIAGRFGYCNSIRKKWEPFENVTKQQLKEELVNRGGYYSDNKKKSELSEMLTNIVQGCQRLIILTAHSKTRRLESGHV